MSNEVPVQPFFGTQVGVASGVFHTTKNKSASVLDCTRNYLLRLIVKERRLVPPQWWLLATQAVYNHELRHNKQIVSGDQPVDHVMLLNLQKFYDDDASCSYDPELARLDHNLEPIPVETSVPQPPPITAKPVSLPTNSEADQLFVKHMY